MTAQLDPSAIENVALAPKFGRTEQRGKSKKRPVYPGLVLSPRRMRCTHVRKVAVTAAVELDKRSSVSVPAFPILRNLGLRFCTVQAALNRLLVFGVSC